MSTRIIANSGQTGNEMLKFKENLIYTLNNKLKKKQQNVSED